MKKIILFLFSVLLYSCDQTGFDTSTDLDSKIVVEGWIEEGEYAQVILSSSIPVNSAVDSLTILSHAIRSAKVTVSDGQNQEVLRLKRDNDRIPPFIYYGSDLIGQAGKTYTLKVEFLNRVVTSETVIPNSVELKKATYVKNVATDTTGYVFIEFSDPVLEKNYYQIATKIDGEEPIFVPAFYGNLNDDSFNSSEVSMQVNRGVLVFPKTKFKPYFTDGDLIYVKLRTMNKTS